MKNDSLTKRIDAWFDTHAGEMLDDLKALIRVRSINGTPEEGCPHGKGPAEAMAVAKQLVQAHGFEIRDFDNSVFTADLNGAAPELGILVHVDVVPEGEGWDSEPFEAEIREGKLYGRGASDDKGPAAAAMYAMYAARDIAPSLTKGFRLIVGSAEEIGCEDLKLYLTKEKPPRYVFSPDADYPLINTEKGRFVLNFGAEWAEDTALPRIVSVKGGVTPNVVPNKAEALTEGFELPLIESKCAEFAQKTGLTFTAEGQGVFIKIHAEGVAAHAQRPDKGNNAQTGLVALLSALPAADSRGFQMLCALQELFPHGDTQGRAAGVKMADALSGELTLNFGVLDFTLTGFTGNFDSRTPACATRENLLDVVTNALQNKGIERKELFCMTHCHHTPADSPFVQTLLRIYEEYTGQKGEALAIGGTTYVHNIEGGVAFGCAMPGIDYRIHGANEFIGVDELILSAKMFTRAILDICS